MRLSMIFDENAPISRIFVHRAAAMVGSKENLNKILVNLRLVYCPTWSVVSLREG
jgi:hypothetical protein